jgi:hypothetical protein
MRCSKSAQKARFKTNIARYGGAEAVARSIALQFRGCRERFDVLQSGLRFCLDAAASFAVQVESSFRGTAKHHS